MQDSPKDIHYKTIYEPDIQRMKNALRVLLDYQSKEKTTKQKVKKSKSA